MAYRQNDSQGRNDRVRFDLIEHIGVLSKKDNGWTREVNIVAWNDGPAKVDIREWDQNHTRMTKGVTLFEEEAETLATVLAERYGLFRAAELHSRSYQDDRRVYTERPAAGPEDNDTAAAEGDLMFAAAESASAPASAPAAPAMA